MAGWTAVVNGETRPTTSTDGLFQDVSITAGLSTTQFSIVLHLAGASFIGSLSDLSDLKNADEKTRENDLHANGERGYGWDG